MSNKTDKSLEVLKDSVLGETNFFQKPTDDLMDGLHGLTFQAITKRLLAGDCSEKDISNAMKFLKDNNVSMFLGKKDVPEEILDVLDMDLDDIPDFDDDGRT